jgi:hypothetical protein
MIQYYFGIRWNIATIADTDSENKYRNTDTVEIKKRDTIMKMREEVFLSVKRSREAPIPRKISNILSNIKPRNGAAKILSWCFRDSLQASE